MNDNQQKRSEQVAANSPAVAVSPVPNSTSAPASALAPTADPKISYDDFAKVEIKAGKIVSAEKVPNTDKLLKLSVDFAEPAGQRQIISGISMYFPDPAVLVGRTAMFVTNLQPRKIKGLESNGMLFAVSTEPAATEATSPANPANPAASVAAVGTFSLLEPGPGIPPGTRAK